MKMLRNFLWMLIVLILAVPVAAQGDEPFADVIRDNGVMLVMLLVIMMLLVVFAFAVNRLGVSVPQDALKDFITAWDKQTDALIDTFRMAANKTTDDPLDNFAVDGAQLIKEAVERGIRAGLQIPEVANPLAVGNGNGSVVYEDDAVKIERVGAGQLDGLHKPDSALGSANKVDGSQPETKVFSRPSELKS